MQHNDIGAALTNIKLIFCIFTTVKTSCLRLHVFAELFSGRETDSIRTRKIAK